MMNSVDLYRTLEDEVGLETGWHEVGSLRLASSAGADGGARAARPAGRRRSACRSSSSRPSEAQRLFPPMSTDGVLGAAYLPTDGYIDPSQLTFALAEGARRRGAEINTNTRVTGIERRARPRAPASRPTRARSRPRSSSTRAACSRREIGAPRRRRRADRPDGPRVPDHPAERPPARHADDARPLAARLLPRRVGRPRHGRLRAQPGAVGPRRHPGGLQRQAAGRGLGALRAS